MIRKSFVGAALAAAALGLSACTPASSVAIEENCAPDWEFPTVQEGKLTIVGPMVLPYILDVQDGQETKGIDGDLYTEFAKRACLVPDFSVMGGPAAVAALTQGQADMGAGAWLATEERGKSIGQTDAVWYNYSGIASLEGYSSLDDLQGKTIGVIGGSVYAKPVLELFGQESVRQYESTDAILQELKAGRIDAGIGQVTEFGFVKKEQGFDELSAEVIKPDARLEKLTKAGKINFPHTLGNAELTKALNAYIAEIRSNGTVKEVLKKHGLTDSRYLEPSQ